MQLNRERDKMRSKQHKKPAASTKDSNYRTSQDQNVKPASRSNESVERRPNVHDVDDSSMYDQPDVIVYKAVKRGTNIGSYEKKSSNIPRGGRSHNNEESEDDVLHDSLEGPLRPTEKRNPVPSSPSPVYMVDDSLIHSHLSVIAEEDEMIRDSLSGTGVLSNLSRSGPAQSTHAQASPKVVLRKSAGKSNAVVADSLEGPQNLRLPPRLERQASSRTQSSRSASRNDDGVDTEAEEVQTGRRSSEADSIEYGQFIKTDHNYDDVIAGLGDDYNAWDDLDREETELDNVIMEDSLRRSRNFQNDLVLAGLKHANEVIKSELSKQPHSRSAPRSRGGSQDDGRLHTDHDHESNRQNDSAIPRFTSRKSTSHLKAFDSDGSLSQRTDSHGAHTNDLNTPPRGGPKQEKFSPEKPYIPSVRDLLAVSPEPPRRQDHGIASDVPRLNLAREAPPAPKSMLSRLEQAQQMYEANVKKNFPTHNAPTGQSNPSVQPAGHEREYSLSPVPLSGRSRSNSGAERSPRRVPPVLLPTPAAGAQNLGLRGPSPRLQHYHEAPSPTPSQQSGYGYQHAQAHAPLTQRGVAGADSYPQQQQALQGQGYQQQQGYQQSHYQQGYQDDQQHGYEQEVSVPKSIRLPAPSAIPQPEQRAQQPALQPLAQPAAQRRPPQFPGQVQNEAPVRQQPAAPKQAAGGYFAAYTDSQQQQGRAGAAQQPLQAAPAALAPVAGRFSNLPLKLIPAAVARAPVKAAPVAAVSKNANGRPKDMSQTKLTELQEQKLLEEIEELNRIQLQKLQELAQIEQNEKNAAAAAAAAAARSNSPRKRVADPVRDKEKRAFKAGAKDVNPTPVLVKLKSKPSAGAARGVGPVGVDEWGEAVQRDQPRAGSNVRGRNGLALNVPGNGNAVNNSPSPVPIQPLLAPPTGVDIHGGLNPGGFAAGAGYLQVYKKKQEVGQRGNSNPRGRRGNGEDNISANGDAQSEGRLFNRRQNAAPQHAQAQYEETASLPAIPSTRNVKSSGSARVGGQQRQGQGQGQGGGYYEGESEAPLSPQFVHPLDGQNRRVLSASRNNTVSAPSRLLDEQQGGGYSSNMNGNANGNGYGRAPDRNALPELVKVSHDYGMPSQLPVPMYNMQKKVAPMKGYSKR